MKDSVPPLDLPAFAWEMMKDILARLCYKYLPCVVHNTIYAIVNLLQDLQMCKIET